MLTKEELQQLRKEIVLGSLFISDYSNTLGLDKKKVCDFFNGYEDYLWEIAQEQNDQDKKSIFKRLFKKAKEHTPYEYDNIETLWNWYLFFENDPLN